MTLLNYKNKKSEQEILGQEASYRLVSKDSDSTNKLIKGDNFPVLKTLLYDYNFSGKIDLIYIDPPFSTQNNFTISEGRANTISNGKDDEIAYTDSLSGSDYLEFLRERLIILRELLSTHGSIYLHIDYKIGHYVKVLMDEIFGIDNFRNDITRIKCNPKNFHRRAFGNIKDLILFYSKTKQYIWNEPKVEITEVDITKLFKKIDSSGRRYTTIPLHAPGETKNGATSQTFKNIAPPKGRHWRSDPKELEKLDKMGLIEWSKTGVPRKIIYADEQVAKGKKLQDIWEYKDPQYPNYPTEKNQELLDLIIKTSSHEGSYVLDCFAGGGTSLISAHSLNRSWVGIDNSEQAIKVIKKNFSKLPNTLFSREQYQYFELVSNIINHAI